MKRLTFIVIFLAANSYGNETSPTVDSHLSQNELRGQKVDQHIPYENLNPEEAVKLISTSVLKDEYLYKIFELAEKHEDSITPLLLNIMVDNYYTTENIQIKDQITTFLSELKNSEQTATFRKLYKDNRLSNEEDYKLFFATVYTMISDEDQKNTEAVFNFMGANAITDTPHPPIIFANLGKEHHKELIYEIIELTDEKSNSLLSFIVCSGYIASNDSEKDTNLTNKILKILSSIKGSESAEGIHETISDIRERLRRETTNTLEQTGFLEEWVLNKNAEWAKRLVEKTAFWDKKLDCPKRRLLRRKQELIKDIESQLEFAKSSFNSTLSDIDKKEKAGKKVQFNEIKIYLNEIRRKQDESSGEIKTMEELEILVDREIIDLGTYDGVAGQEGDKIHWGPSKKHWGTKQ